MAELQIRTENIDFLVGRPEKLSMGEWQDVHQLHRDAVVAAVTPDLEVWRAEAHVDWDAENPHNTERYAEFRKNPNHAVARGFLRPQLVKDGIIVRALDGDELVGFATNYNATSGRSLVATTAKMFWPARRWAWTWDTAVRPDHQGRGIAHVLGLQALCRREAEQPTSAYTYPEFREAGAILEGVGFMLQDSTPDEKAFGGSYRTELARYTANTGQVREGLLTLTGIENARNHTRITV